ncbi:MAG: alpha/beta hydrolase [Chthoniobacter sp.]|uniref:alpha/beta hydrolase n=1 Tax=Chthoniobacter sp. TaxID=2510640 RepID=UPI0032A9212D
MRFPSILALFVLCTGGTFLPPNCLRAEPAPEEVHVVKDIAYKSGDALTDYEKSRCKLDLYLPASGDHFPALVWFHGGGLTGGTKDADSTKEICRRFARAGIAVAAVNYRLSPKATYPAYLDDSAAAFAWVKTHAAEQHINPARVFVGGHSAGGYLAFMLGLDARWLKPYDMAPSAIAGLIPVSGQVMTHYTVREERGIKDHNVISADEAAPINHLHKDTPPFLILYADKDMPARREESMYLAAALRATGNPRVQQLQIDDRTHGSIAGNMVHPGDPAAEAILHFIANPAAAPKP